MTTCCNSFCDLGMFVKAPILWAGREQSVSVWFIGVSVAAAMNRQLYIFQCVRANDFSEEEPHPNFLSFLKRFRNYMVVIECLSRSSIWLLSTLWHAGFFFFQTFLKIINQTDNYCAILLDCSPSWRRLLDNICPQSHFESSRYYVYDKMYSR